MHIWRGFLPRSSVVLPLSGGGRVRKRNRFRFLEGWRSGAGVEFERFGRGLKGSWEAPDGGREGERGVGVCGGGAARSGAEGGGNQMLLDGMGTAPEGRRTGRAGGGKGRSFGAVTGQVAWGVAVAGPARAEGGRLSGRWWSAAQAAGAGDWEAPDGAGRRWAEAIQFSRHGPEPWAGEIEMLLGRVWDGHGAGGRRTGRAGGGKGPQLRRRDRPRGQGRCRPGQARGEGGGALPSPLEVGEERAAAC